MSEAKFTKGEWYAHPNGVGCGGIAIVNTPKGCVIPKAEDTANQDLIAAAPKMYEMLSDFLSMDSLDVKLLLENSSCVSDLLAKARGEK